MARRLLAVNDKPQVVALLKSRLKANKYEMITACNGESCLERLKMSYVKLILIPI